MVAGIMVTLCGVLIVSLESTESEGGGGAGVEGSGDDILIEEVELTRSPDGILATHDSASSSRFSEAAPMEKGVEDLDVGVVAACVGVEDGGVVASNTISHAAAAAAPKRRMTWGYLAAAVNVSLDTWSGPVKHHSQRSINTIVDPRFLNSNAVGRYGLSILSRAITLGAPC